MDKNTAIRALAHNPGRIVPNDEVRIRDTPQEPFRPALPPVP